MGELDWTMVAPEAAGFSSLIVSKLDAGVESGLLRGLHAVAVSRNGQLVFERYYAGEDETILRDLGHVAFLPDTPHDLRSVTKSVVGTLYGIALDRGLVPGPDTPLLQEFPEYPDLGADSRRRRLTIEHALTMTLGMEWDESKPYTTTENSEIAMEFAADRYRFVLDRPIIGPPGEVWIYSGGAVALIGAIIERATHKRLPEFAREALFEPLGIVEHEWFAGKDGAYSAAAGLRLSTRSLLKVGALLAGRGVFAGKRIVSEAWLGASWQKRVRVRNGPEHYGYLWYLGDAPVAALDGRKSTVGAYGNGGQRLFLMPELGLACVVYCGRYNQPEEWLTPDRVWREIILANLELP